MATILDWQVKKILNVFRLTKNIYRQNKEETAFDRSIAESEGFLNNSLKQ